MVTLRKSLCEFYAQIKESRSYSFSEMLLDSELSRSQLNNILKHEGRRVSIDKMLDGIDKLGFNLEITISEAE